MKKPTPTALLLVFLSWISGPSAMAQNYVCAETNLGDFCMTLFPEFAPNTVDNFLNYVNDGDYDGTLIHRSVFQYILQGGGYTYDPLFDLVPTDPPIANEFTVGFSLSNLRGSVAMAKIEGDPDSATSQWFVNLANNSTNLDSANEGFTVFARISYGMDVIDAIADLRLVNLATSLGAAFTTVPVLQDQEGVLIEFPDDFVQIRRMYATDILPAVATFRGQSLTFPVEISGMLYRVTLDLTAQSSAFLFNVDRSSLSLIEDSGQDRATMDLLTGILTIPSLQVGSRRFANVTLQLTDNKSLEFTLTGFE